MSPHLHAHQKNRPLERGLLFVGGVMKTISRVEDPIIFELNSLARKLAADGKKPLNLGQAVPDLRPPAGVMAELGRLAGSADINSYPPDAGLPELRSLISETYLAPSGAAYDPETELIITAGANHAYMTAILTVTDPEDEVVLFSPYYFNHGMALDMLSRRKVELRLAESAGWELDVAAFRKAVTARTKAAVLVNPNNPTGAVFPAEAVKELCSVCRERGIFLISDEVYDGYLFNGSHFRPASMFRDTVITIGSLSKTIGFMGWRIGYMAAPERVVRQAIKVQDTSIIAACYAGQLLAVKAIKARPFPAGRYIAGLEARKNALRDGLAGIKELQWREPQGAMFAMARLKEGLSPRETAFRLLREKGVIVVPCESFGPGGKNHLRISFGCLPRESIIEAAALIADFFR